MTKLPIPDIENYAGFITEKYNKAISDTANQIENEIKKRITDLGIDINNIEFIKNNFEFVEKEGDEFKHLFYKPESKCIISIQKMPTINFCSDIYDLVNNTVSCIMTYKYY